MTKEEKIIEVQETIRLLEEFTGDIESRTYWRKVAFELPPDLIRSCISETKEAERLDKINSSKTRYLVWLLEQYRKHLGNSKV